VRDSNPQSPRRERGGIVVTPTSRASPQTRTGSLALRRRLRVYQFPYLASRASSLPGWSTSTRSLWTVSNRLPLPYGGSALPGELQRHGFRGWTRTTEGKGQGLAGDAGAPPGTAYGRRASNPQSREV
jgi:hypothetical protein